MRRATTIPTLLPTSACTTEQTWEYSAVCDPVTGKYSHSQGSMENIYRTLNISQKLVESYIAIGISLLPEIYLLLCYFQELFPANIKSVIDFYCWMFCSC